MIYNIILVATKLFCACNRGLACCLRHVTHTHADGLQEDASVVQGQLMQGQLMQRQLMQGQLMQGQVMQGIRYLTFGQVPS